VAFLPFRAEGLDELRRKADIVAVVSQTVALRRQGQRLVGLCPFHQEKSPSFSVSAERGLFYCFGCHAGGDVIDYVMKRDGFSFPDAAAYLAAEFHVELAEEEATPEAAQRQERRQVLLRLLEAAQERFSHHLRGPQGEAARRYLAGRGLSGEDLSRFDLGYAVGGDDVCRALKASPELLLEAGLGARSQGGRLYDRFRERVTFAIRDRAGHIVGFGGRLLGDGQPKYLNSAETPLFHKGSLLYGWSWAMRKMREEQAVTLVEGYMDAIALHRGGYVATVATLGTALTEDHARQLGRAVKRAYLAFDSDAAGQAAVRRSAEPLLQQGIEVLVAMPQGGKDPDEILKAPGGVEAWRATLEQAASVTDWLYAVAARRHDASTPDGKAAVAQEVFTAIRAIQSPLVRDEELRRLAQRLEVREEALRLEYQRGTPGGDRTHTLARPRNSTRNTAETPKIAEWLPIERQLLALASQYPARAAGIRAACRPLHDQTLDAALELAAAGRDVSAAEDEAVRSAWAEASLAVDLAESEVEKTIARWAQAGIRLRLNEVNRRIRELLEAGQAVDPSLLVQAHELSRELGASAKGGEQRP
jgi:DNA primase